MFGFIKKVFGDTNDRSVKGIQPLVDEINALEPQIQPLSDEQLREKTTEFKQRLQDGTLLDDLLPEAFATVREVSRRTNGQRHYDVQLIGGIVLHQGKIAEMKTGEGKTLVATLPLYLNALEGKGAHLVTVNEYLAKVGAGWMGPIYHRLGLSIATIAHDYSALFDPEYIDPTANPEDQRLVHWRPCSRREAYAADITYGTNNEFGFDYLRDNMVVEQDQLVQRKLHFGIVDEVDNILIDEARTPLIISGPAQESSDDYRKFAALVRDLRLAQSPYTLEQMKKDFIEDPEGDYFLDLKARSIQLTDAGIAKVEQRLGIPDTESLYDPKYYEATHFLENALRAKYIYHRDHDYIVDQNAEVVIVDEFTGRSMAGRRWSDGLHQSVEAKESVPVRQENVTLATITFQNFFRLYQKLCGMTGTAQTEKEELGKIYNLDVVTIPTNKPMVRDDQHDQIYRSEEAKFGALLREIEDMRAIGRPVLVGTTSVETSERLSDRLKQHDIPHNVLNAKQHEREAHIIAQAGRKGAVTIATNMAGRGTDILLGGNPDGLLEDLLANKGLSFEDVTPDQIREVSAEAKQITSAESDEIRDLGGLHIIGTERHEARRIDNQLRGRAGRQGDPGSSRFFLSLEDELMRRFGPMERIKGIMERLGVDDDVPIEAKLINRSIESAQTRVEGYNFDMRKHTVEFDDVMNKQRTAIYNDRRAILAGDNMRERVLDMIADEVAALIAQHLPEAEGHDDEEWDDEALLRAVRTIAPNLPDEIAPDDLDGKSRDEIEDYLVAQLEAAYTQREQTITDENMRFVERRMMLSAIDRQWIDYLTGMEDLRQEIGMQAIAQRDPLQEYQRNAGRMFEELKSNIQRDIAYQIMPVSYQYEQHMRQMELEQQQRMMVAQQAGMSEEEQAQATKQVQQVVKTIRVGRNDPCPCGSGRKFKDCHLGKEQELLALIQLQQLSANKASSGQPRVAAPAAKPQTLSAQLAMGGTGAKPQQRGRSVPPVSGGSGNANGGDGPANGKTKANAQSRGKQASKKK